MDGCEGKDFALTPALTLFVTDCQSVKRKSEGVRAKNKKKLFSFFRSIFEFKIKSLEFSMWMLQCSQV